MNYISYNEELKEIENELKELSEKYQQDYAERGKYIKSETAQATILYLNFILTLVIFIKLDDLGRLICVAIYGLIVSFVLTFGKNLKLSIVSKKSYTKKIYPKFKFDLKSNYNLEVEYITIDYDKIEFHLNQKALSKLRKK